MSIFALRTRLSVTLVVSVAILVLAYSYAGYLVRKRSSPDAGVGRPPAASAPSPQQLLAAGDAHLKAGRAEQALLAYREVLAANPDSLPAQLGVAQGELLAGRETVAVGEFERVLKLDQRNQTSTLLLASLYSHQPATWPQAEQRYRQSLQLAPQDVSALLGLARVLAWQGKAGEAARVFSQNEVAVHMTIADRKDFAFALVKAGALKDAEPLLKKLIETDPADTRLRLQLASIYVARKDWNAALPIYKELLAHQPRDPKIQLDYGLALLSLKNYRAALAPLRAARDAMPSSGEAGLAYARALKGAHDLKGSVKEYERIEGTFRHNSATVREYADTLLEKRDYRKAANSYGEAYRLGLRDTRLLVACAGALSGEGKYRAAVPYLEEAYRRDHTPRLGFELARLMQKTGRTDRARELLREVEAASPKQVATVNKGK